MEEAVGGGVARKDDGFERRRGEGVPPRRRVRGSDRIADPNIAEARELSDLPGNDRRALNGRPAVEHADRRDLPLVVFPDLYPALPPERSREHADVRAPPPRGPTS